MHGKRLTSAIVCGLLIETLAFGVRADDTPAPTITFSREIARIFQNKCQECHRPNQLAPMSLLTFQEARPWAKSIRKAVNDKVMPPWFADSRYGKFSNDIGLSEKEIAAVVQWVDAGAPEGNPADLPPAKVWPDSDWKSGPPDLFLQPKEPFPVRPMKINEDVMQCIVLPTNFEHDTWIQGFEYRPDQLQVVHHMIGYVDDSGRTVEMDAKTPEPGYPCGMWTGTGVSGVDSLIGGWAPGMPPDVFELGTGKLIKKGSYIVLQMHYHNLSDRTFMDRSAVGVYLAKKPIKNRGRIMPVAQIRLNINAGDPNAENRAQWRIARDIDVVDMMPHMHYIGKDMTISAHYADGRDEVLLSVPRFDFNWQSVYHLAERKHIPKGSVINVVGHHDNSDANPRNPNHPPVDVHHGESTTEEMMIGWIGYVYSDEDLKIDPTKPQEQADAAAGAGL